MKYTILKIFVLFLSFIIFGLNCSDNPVKQNKKFNVTFEKTYGYSSKDYGQSVIESADGSYIITGRFMDLPGIRQFNIFLMKTDINGNLVWEKSFGFGDILSNDYGSSVIESSDGGYLIGGSTRATGLSSSDVYIIKTDINGNLVWGKTFGDTTFDDSKSIIETRDGSYMAVGSSYSSNTAEYNVYLLKIDLEGDLVWQKYYGGSFDDYGQSIIETTDGNYLIAGSTSSSGAGGDDVYLLKIDFTGNLLWEKTFGGELNDHGYSIVELSESGYLIVGSTRSYGTGGSDVYLIKTDVNGNLIWEKNFGGTLNDYGYSVIETLDGGYMVTGSTNSSGAGGEDVYLFKTYANGYLVWEKTIGGSSDDFGYSVIEPTNNSYVIAGSTKSFGSGSDDIYLIKIDIK